MDKQVINAEIMEIIGKFNSNANTKVILNSWAIIIAKLDVLLTDKKNGLMVSDDIFELDKITQQRISQALTSYLDLPIEMQKSNQEVTDGKNALELLTEQLVAIGLQVDKIYESTVEGKKLNFLAHHRKMQNISGATSTELDNKAVELENDLQIEEAPEVLKEKGLAIIKTANLRINSWQNVEFKKYETEPENEETGKGLTPLKFLGMIAVPLIVAFVMVLISFVL